MLLATCCQWDDPPSSLTRGTRTLLQLQEGFLVLGTIEIFPLKWPLLIIDGATRWAPTSYKWSYNLYKWPKINGFHWSYNYPTYGSYPIYN